MNGLAARRAIRAHLMNLVVSTTGRTTLSATSSGYARTSGSFIEDGFYRGMEVRPVNFGQSDTGVITRATDLTIDIDGGRLPEAAMDDRELIVGLPSVRLWENEDSTTAVGRPYVEEVFIPGPSTQVTLGPGGVVEYLPIYGVRIAVASGVGNDALDAYMQGVLTHFPPRLAIGVDFGSLQVRTNPAPFAGQMSVLPTGFSVALTSVPLRLRTTNPI